MTTDTICAVSTAPGTGGIAVIRISGPRAIEIAQSVWQGKPLTDTPSHTARYGEIIDIRPSRGREAVPASSSARGAVLDQCVATVFRSPHSFTGEDVVELSIHGSRWLQRELLRLLISQGCRMAQPGEYTRRAVMNGRMDLAQAESVADAIASTSRAAHLAAISQMQGTFSSRIASLRQQLVDLSALLELELDFSEEDVEFASRERLIALAREILAEVTRLHSSFATGQAIKDGIPVAITGATNAGKSSLLNALLGHERAIVSDIHGTTRDTLEETLELGPYLFRFIDTAGLRHTTDPIEQLGISRARQAISRARIILHVIDPTAPQEPQASETNAPREREAVPVSSSARELLILNKADIADTRTSPLMSASALSLSAKTGQGLDTLKERLIAIADEEAGAPGEDILVTNERHATALAAAAESIRRVLTGLGWSETPASETSDISCLSANSASNTSAPPPLSIDLIAQDLRLTISHLSSITGEIPSTEILSTIFSRFCIGK